jgi:hypothetical protein
MYIICIDVFPSVDYCRIVLQFIFWDDGVKRDLKLQPSGMVVPIVY